MSDSKIGAKMKFPTPNWNNHSVMVKYTITTLQAMFGANLTGPINKIDERLTFSILWHLQIQLVNGLRKIGSVQFPLEIHAGYILLMEDFVLFSSKDWIYPGEAGKYYKIPVTEIIETEQGMEENKWKVKKEKRGTFKNLKIVLTKMSEEVVDPTLHSVSRVLGTKG